eukprot:TRINITY_DN16396_c0_g1_i1.p1 TRINITY_DN16396_c0_g1~~TRINITY_DN16396_c0_g1_i1.p1  ORF type:complete len:193 (+),score=14.85 TRINITY_DN16396_c0_g1_i1:346-924(+)
MPSRTQCRAKATSWTGSVHSRIHALNEPIAALMRGSFAPYRTARQWNCPLCMVIGQDGAVFENAGENWSVSHQRHRTEGGSVCHVVVRQGSTILHEPPSEDVPLLIRRDAFLILDLLLESLHCVRGLALDCDLRPHESSHKHLHWIEGNTPVLCVDTCLLYTSDAADEEDSVDLGGRRIIKKKKKIADNGAR